MVTLLTEVSKFIILVLFIIYALYAFIHIKTDEGKHKSHYILKQRIIIFAIHFIAYMILYLNTNNLSILVFYPFELIFLTAYMKFYYNFYPGSNPKLINHYCIFITIGFIMITRLNPDKLFRQFAIIVITSIAAFFIPAIMKRGKFLRRFTWFFGIAGMCMLAAVLLLGNITYGAKINLSISGSTFSPTEIVKLLFVFFVAGVLYEEASLNKVIKVSIVTLVYILLLVVSKDLGGALIFFVTFLVMVYSASRKGIYLVLGAGGFSAAGCIAYKLFSHVRTRINTWTTPFELIRNDTSQISQALFALSSGGLFGTGLTQGLPNIIPVVISDLVFAAICEELGLLFGICLILLYMSCFLQIMHVATQLSDPFYRLLAVGFGVEFILQAILNIGGSVKFIPLTGITLPLISYGGSSAMEMVLLFAMLQGIFILKDIRGNTDI